MTFKCRFCGKETSNFNHCQDENELWKSVKKKSRKKKSKTYLENTESIKEDSENVR